MGDIIPGTTFSSGQLINADILNKLVGDAEIVTKSIKADMMSEDFISALTEIADVTGDDYLLIWDADQNALRKIKKSDLAGSAPQVSSADGTLNLSSSSGSTALDFRGSTADRILTGDNFAIGSDGSIIYPSDVINLIGGETGWRYVSDDSTLMYFPIGSTDPKYTFFGQSISAVGHEPGKNGALILSGRDVDADDGTAQYNNWYIQSSHNQPMLTIYPDNDMTERPTPTDERYAEPRINIRGHVFISDFDDPNKTLLLPADSKRSALVVDDIYSTDGTDLWKDGKLVGASTSTYIQGLVSRIEALENASANAPSGAITHLTIERKIADNTQVAYGQGTSYAVSGVGVPSSATSLYVSLQHNGNAVPNCTFEYFTHAGFNNANKHVMSMNFSDKSQTLGMNFWIPVINGSIYYRILANNTWVFQAHAYI